MGNSYQKSPWKKWNLRHLQICQKFEQNYENGADRIVKIGKRFIHSKFIKGLQREYKSTQMDEINIGRGHGKLLLKDVPKERLVRFSYKLYIFFVTVFY